VAGGFGRCPRQPTTSFEGDFRGRLFGCRANTRGPIESPTALVATRATARIRIRCIPWSAGVEEVVGNNAGSRVDSAECGSPDWRIV
jgi:hypothetical protein